MDTIILYVEINSTIRMGANENPAEINGANKNEYNTKLFKQYNTKKKAVAILI